MNIAILMVSALSMTGYDCRAVDPIDNTAAWVQGGQVVSAEYHDTGHGVRWPESAPERIQTMTTTGRGIALRLECGGQS